MMTDATTRTETLFQLLPEQPYYSQPTMTLRICKGKLQQQFAIGQFFTESGLVHPDRLEWRDVPVVDESESEE